MTEVRDWRGRFSLDTDVLVVGGGAAGVAAAFTAAKAGARVLLLEKYGFCGGAAVAGSVRNGLRSLCGDRGCGETSRTGGIRFCRPVRRRHEGQGRHHRTATYGNTYTLTHDPLVWREAGDHFLDEAGVRVLFHTTVIDVLTEAEQVRGVLAWTKQGRAEIRARLTIDASGDADVAAFGGFETFMGQDGRVQNPTMLFRLMGVDIERLRAQYGERHHHGR